MKRPNESRIETRQEDGKAVISVIGLIDVQALVTELKELVQAGVKQIDLDLGGVKEGYFLDSAALGGFVALLFAVENRGAKVTLVNLPRRLQEILEIANLFAYFK